MVLESITWVFWPMLDASHANRQQTAISDDIEKMKEAQGEGNVEMNAQRAMLRESRQKIRDTMAEREKIHEELKKAADRMKNHDKKAQALRKDNKSLDIGEIDRLIAQINEKLETSSMDLKAEKEQIREMKKLTESKAKVVASSLRLGTDTHFQRSQYKV